MATPQIPRHPLHSSILQFYNSRAPSYDTEDSFHPTLASDFIHWATSIPSNPNPNPTPLKMLDLCCGTGLVSFAARKHFGPESVIHGVDISSASLDIARGGVRELEGVEGEEMRFWEGSVVDLEGLEKGTYGLITCCSAFVLLPGDKLGLIKSWSEYLAPGGVLIFDMPAPGAQIVYKLKSRALEKYGVLTISQDWVAKETLAELIEQAGLKCQSEFVTELYKSEDYRVEDSEDIWERTIRNPLMDVSRVKEEDREAAKTELRE